MDLTLKLKKAVIVDGHEYAELTLNELTVGENIALERDHSGKGPAEQDMYFFAKSCRVPPEVISGMGQRDYVRLKNRFMETLGNVEPE